MESLFIKEFLAKGIDLSSTTNFFCDLCHDNAHNSNGGYCLFENKENPSYSISPFTFSCNRCYDKFIIERDFTNLKNYETQIQQFKIGIDAERYYKMNKDNTFYENMYLFKKDQKAGKYGEDYKKTEFNLISFISRRNTNDIQEYLNNPEILEENKEKINNALVTCTNCGNHGRRKELQVCSNCKIARYCNEICQKNGWVTHKKICILRD